MNKQMIVGLCVGGLLATAGGALALRDSGPKVAEVVSVKPITAGMEQEYAEVVRVAELLDPNAPRFVDVVDVQPVKEPGSDEEVCQNVTVTHKAPVKDQHQIAGTATGAVIGGVLGHQVGGGNGKKVATAAGAVVGGIIGKNVQANHQAKQTYQTTERQCRVSRGEDQVTGYDVTYTVDGESATVFMDYKPGKQLPMLNGELVTDQAEVRQLNRTKAPESYEVFYEYGKEEGVVVMPTAPKLGTMLAVEDGLVVTDPRELARIQARQHKVVAYDVVYRLGDELSETRMTEKPRGSTLLVKNGEVVMADAKANRQSL